MHQRERERTIALQRLDHELQELFSKVTNEVNSAGPRVLTPDLSRFVVLSAERARLTGRRRS